jgi:hypothetical protein
MPFTDFGTWRWRAASLIASVATVVIMLGLSEVGLPFWVAFPVAIAVGFSPILGYAVRHVFREARRQGWGRNV